MCLTKKYRYSDYLASRTKRLFDVIVCLLILPPAIVIVSLLCIVIFVRDGRPVFFIQDRVGKNGSLFRMPKLRSMIMRPNSDDDTFKFKKEITSTGHFLRQHRLDELPQIICVLAGSMSFIGPRPDLPCVVASYNSSHMKRLSTTPGITGLWQILGNRSKPMHHGVKYDLYYLRKASLWLDFKILFMTIPFTLRVNKNG